MSAHPGSANIEYQDSAPAGIATGNASTVTASKANEGPTLVDNVISTIVEVPTVVIGKSLEMINKYVGIPEWVALHPLLAHYLAETLGTYLLVLTAALVLMNNPTIPNHPESNISFLPIGFMLMVLVFTFGYISGGHFNPCVTFGVWLAKRNERMKLSGYMLCQVGGAFGAGITTMLLEENPSGIAYPHPSGGSTGDFIRRSFFSEFIITFALSFVVLITSYSTQRANFFYGFCIGMTVLAGVSCVGGVSGGAFNPALATGLQVTQCLLGNCDSLVTLWLYWVAPFLAAGLASYIFQNLTLSNGQPVFDQSQG